MRGNCRTLFAALALLSAGVQAGPPALPLGCLIEPKSVSEIGSPVVGVIETMLVERGDRVVAGQPLANLRADVERVSVSVAQGRAQGLGELRAAEANHELARQKLARAQDLADKQFISSQALEQARAEALVAENRLTQAREQRDIYERERQLAVAQLGLRTIRSPTTGVVVERYMSVGERVEEKPMFRIAVIDPLRVEVVLPASLFPVVKQGMPVRVTPDFPGAAPRIANIALVDQVIEGASNTFRIRLSLPNKDGALPAGLRCRADLGNTGDAGTPPAGAAGRASDTNLQTTGKVRVAPRL